ncbi:STAS domain-containing protein [uncultured Tateyamaria sp.]|uniref:STAS domain-containing protein n=1 Tax=uncultured Tateyamaria sp. TaxID=455651 RepID=UPI00262679F4|nr:STAS domain-containing protein [uncultured Tateyamaria sp.]
MVETLTLPPRLDASTVNGLSREITSRLDTGKLRFDGSGVTHMGALGVQLIMSAARSVRANGGQIEFTDLSDRAERQLSYMGITPENLVEGA